MLIRKFQNKDAEVSAKIIQRTFLKLKQDAEAIHQPLKTNVRLMDLAHLLVLASSAHIYVVELGAKVIGLGAISSYYGRQHESLIQSVYIDPDHQNKGFGEALIRALEKDSFYLRAVSVKVLATNNMIPFFARFGYQPSEKYSQNEFEVWLEKKTGNDIPDEWI